MQNRSERESEGAYESAPSRETEIDRRKERGHCVCAPESRARRKENGKMRERARGLSAIPVVFSMPTYCLSAYLCHFLATPCGRSLEETSRGRQENAGKRLK